MGHGGHRGMMGRERPGAVHPNTGARKWRGCRAVWGWLVVGDFYASGALPRTPQSPKANGFP